MNKLKPIEIVEVLEKLHKEKAGEDIYNSGKEFLRTLGLNKTNSNGGRFKVGLAIRGIPVSLSPNYSIRRALPNLDFTGRKARVYFYKNGEERTATVGYLLKVASWKKGEYQKGDYRTYSFSWGGEEE